jgi:hypothetical protein
LHLIKSVAVSIAVVTCLLCEAVLDSEVVLVLSDIIRPI